MVMALAPVLLAGPPSRPGTWPRRFRASRARHRRSRRPSSPSGRRSARLWSLSAAFQASFTSANGTFSTSMPICSVMAGSDTGPAAADRQDLRLLHAFEALVRCETVRAIVGRAVQIARRPASAAPAAAAVAATKSADRSARLDQLEALDGLDQIVDLRRGHEADVRRLACAGSRPCRPGIRRCRHTGNRRTAPACPSGDRLHHLVPAVHLKDEIAVDAGRRVVIEDLLGLLGPGGHAWGGTRCRDSALASAACVALHDRAKSNPTFGQSGPGCTTA